MKMDLDSKQSALQKISKQNALSAALGAAFWSVPILVLWAFLFELKPAAGPVMLLISGALVGAAVRFHGRGYERLFSLIGLIAHACIVFVAWDLQIILVGGVLAVILVGVYIFGAWGAAYISRINVSMHDHKEFDKLFESADYQKQKKLKNRWFIVLPVVSVLTLVAGFITAIGIVIFQQQQHIDIEVQQHQQRAAEFRGKHIETNNENLASMSTKKALTYAYAYQSGRHFDERGYYKGAYPQDSFQALVILRYLANEKKNPRAQFILGKILNNEKGQALLLQAEKAGDEFAMLYSIYEFGCLIDAKRGKQLLMSFAKNIEEQSVIIDIQSMNSDDFNDHCTVLDSTEFDYRYIRDY
ncbi:MULTISPECIES: hypothetical protein [unclassified Pseudoalteromonas]|uniref:hypothetical protein n=1 Tax=unclassified Pseudoalteromonas TaxID=194690 RepID=UPI0002AAE42B|nr:MULTISPECIES: hypothetical protein [unclassified Pseudoalteromonas]ALQ07127.1 hypothetical protein D172_003050 [Pseudoalteromonas sp. Bsw20308]KDC51266.1 hypothetical protein DO88_16225 [Pseudoalteromonas sp. S3431]